MDEKDSLLHSITFSILFPSVVKYDHNELRKENGYLKFTVDEYNKNYTFDSFEETEFNKDEFEVISNRLPNIGTGKKKTPLPNFFIAYYQVHWLDNDEITKHKALIFD